MNSFSLLDCKASISCTQAGLQANLQRGGKEAENTSQLPILFPLLSSSSVPYFASACPILPLWARAGTTAEHAYVVTLIPTFRGDLARE